MDRPWFDPESGRLKFDDYLCEMPSFRAAIEDDRVTGDEVVSQARRVEAKMRELEGLLSPEQKAVATDALCELTVLNALAAMQHGK